LLVTRNHEREALGFSAEMPLPIPFRTFPYSGKDSIWHRDFKPCTTHESADTAICFAIVLGQSEHRMISLLANLYCDHQWEFLNQKIAFNEFS